MMRFTAEQREQVVRAARAWIGTPYHPHARVKGAGADCAMFPIAVYQECGLLPLDYLPPSYSPQWHLHRSEEIYLREIQRFAVEMPGPPQPGDFVVYQFGRAFSHGALVVDWPLIIHSYVNHGVVLSDGVNDGALLGREHKFFERDMAKPWA
jgi:cell wall-associated NlpC family hydrolase